MSRVANNPVMIPEKVEVAINAEDHSAGAVAGMLIPFAVPTMPAQDAGSGYLSSSYAPFSLGSDPANGGFRVQDLSLPANVTNDRFTARKNMLDAVNAHFAGKERSDNLDAMDTFYQRAYGLISSEKAREAFAHVPVVLFTFFLVGLLFGNLHGLGGRRNLNGRRNLGGPRTARQRFSSKGFSSPFTIAHWTGNAAEDSSAPRPAFTCPD